MSRKLSLLLFSIAVLLGAAGSLSAQNFWNTGAGNWNTVGNWSLGHVPLAGEDVEIGSSGSGPVTVDTAAVCTNFTISGAGGITVSGFNTLSISGNVSINTTGAVSTSLPITMSGAGVTLSSNRALGDLTITGTVSMTSPVSVRALALSAGGAFSTGGNALGVAGNLTQAGGTLTSASTVTLNGTAAQGVDFSTATLNSLTVNSTGPVTFNSAVVVGATFTHTAGTIALNGNGLTVNGGASLGATIGNAGAAAAVSITGATTLAAATSITTNGGGITFGNTVNGTTAGVETFTLVAGAGNVNLNGAVGAATRLGTLTITSVGTLNTLGLRASSIATTATGTSTFGGALNTNAAAGISLTGTTININSTVTTTGTGTVTVTNSGVLTIAAAGDMTLDGAFTQNGAGTVTTSGDITTTNDTISFLRAVTLGGAVALNTGAGAGNITFSNTVNGGFSLNLTAGTGAVGVTGAIGATAALSALTVSGSTVSLGSIGGAGAGVTGATAVTASTAMTLSGTTYRANAQSYTSPAGYTITLSAGAAVSFISTDDAISFVTAGVRLGNGSDISVASGGGAISVLGGIDGTSSEDVSLVSTGGTTNTMSVGPIGATADAINTVALQASTSVTLNGNITTSNLAGNTVTVTGPCLLGAGVVVDTNTAGVDGAISFTSTINNAQTLSLDAGSATVGVTGAIGATAALSALTVSGSTVSLGSIGGAGAGVTGATAVTASTAMTLSGTTYRANAQSYTSPAGYTITLSAGAAVSFISTDDAISFVTAGVKLNNGSDISVASGGGAISVLGGIDGTSSEDVSLVSTGGTTNTVSVGPIGATADAINTVALQASTSVTLNGNITTSNLAGNTVTVTGPCLLGAGVTVDTDTAGVDGAISFTSTIDNAQALSLVAGTGAVSLSGVVGGTVALSSLTVGGATITTVGIGGGAAGVTGAANLTATTSITFTGTTYWGNAATYDAGAAGNNLNMNAGALTTFTASADTITFIGTIQLSAGTDLVVNTAGAALAVGAVQGTGAQSVTFRSTDITLNGLIAGVGTLSLYSSGATTIGVGGGAGTYQISDAEIANISSATLVRIGESTVQSGLITVQTAGFAVGVGGLEVNSNSGAGSVALDDAATATALALGSAGTITVRAGTGGVTATQATGANAELGTAGGGSVAISSAGAVGTAANRVQFAAGQGNVAVTVTGAGAGAYLSGVNVVSLGAITTNGGTVNVTTQAGGMTIGGAVTTVGGAASFDTGGAATINLNANVATAGGAISFADPVVVGINSTLTSAGGISFSSTVDALGAGAQSLDATGGAVTIAGPVGAATALSSLTVSGTNVSVGSIGGAGAGVTGATAVTASTAMTLSGTTYRANAQSYTSPAGYTITLSAGAAVSFISTDDAISFVTAGVRLNNGSDISVASGGGAISVLGGIDGTSSEDVSLVSTGGTTNTMSVGPIGATADGINTVALQASTSVTLNGNITTSNLAGNTVTVTGPCLLGAGVTVDTDTAGVDGAISFTSTIDNAQALSLVAGSATVGVTGAIGATAALSALTVSGSTVSLGSIGGAGAGVTGATAVTASTAMTLSGTTYRANAQSYTSPAGYTITLSAGAAVSFISTDDAISFVTAGVKLNNGSDISVASGGGAISVLGGIDGTSSEDVSLVSTGGTTNTVSVGPIGATADAINTVALQASTSVTLNGNITTSNLAGNTVTVTGPCLLGAGVTVDTDTAGVDGAISFTSTIDNAQALSLVAGTGAVSLSGVVGGTVALSSLTVGGATITTVGIGGGAAGVTGAANLTATTSITFTGTTYWGNAATYDAGAAGNNLNMNAGALTTFTASADTITFIGTIQLSAGTDLVVNTAGAALAVGAVQGTGAQSVTFRSTDITLNGLIAGVGTLSLYSSGATTIGVGGGAGTYQISDAEIANISSATLVRIGESTVQSGLITVQTAGFAVGVGGLEVNSNSGAGSVALDDAATATALALGSAGTITVRAGTGGVTATQATGANAELGTAGGGSVAISSAGAVGTAANRVQFAAGQGNVAVTVTGAGAGAYLSGVNVVSLGAITTNGGTVNVTTQAGGMTIGGAVTTVGGAASFDTGGAATINLNANVATAGGAISFADPVVVGINSTLTSAGGISFSSTVDALGAGAQSLDATGGAVTIAGPVGAATALSSLTVSGTNVSVGSIGGAGAGVTGATAVTASTAMTLSGTTYRANAQSYTSPAGYTITLSAGAAVSFISTDDAISFVTAGVKLGNGSDISVTSGGGAISVPGGIDGTSSEDVSLVSTGGATNTVSVGPIGVATADGINTVALQASTSVTLNGNITTSNLAGNTVTVTGPCLLGAGVTIDTDTAGVDGNVDFTGAVNGAAGLTVTSGGATVRFGAGVTTVGAQVVTAATIQTNGTHQTTNTDITLTGNVVLQAATAFDTGAGAGNITVTGTVNGAAPGAQSLGLTSGTGTINLQSAVGGGTSLSTLTVSAPTATARFGGNVTTTGAQSITATTIQTNGTHQTSNTSIDFNGALVLQASTVATAGNGSVTFSGTVDAAAVGVQGLTVNTTGTTTFVGTVGTTSLASVTTNAGGTTIPAALMQTTGNQAYGDTLDLGQNARLVGAVLSFAAVTGNGFNFWVTPSASVTIDGATVTGVKNLDSSGAGITTITGNITTTGTQIYVNAVVVSGAGASLDSTGTNITFSSTVNGAVAGTQALSMDAGAGNVTLGSTVGAPTSLASFSATAALITIRSITTTGNQSFTGPAGLGAASVLTTSGGNITFSSTIDGGAGLGLSLVPHAGTATVSGNVTNIGTLTLQDNTGASTGMLIFNGSVQASTLATFGRAYAIEFNAGGTLTNFHNFLNTGNLTILNGFTFDAGAQKNAGTKRLAGIIVTTGDVLDFNTTPVTLIGNTTINTGIGVISLGAVTGTFTLALTTSVNATIESMIDAGATLDLSTVTGGTVTVSGALTTLALTTAVTGVNIALSGGGSIQNAVTFNNTGNVSISNGFTFANGVLPPGGAYPALTSLAGAVSATAGTIDFGSTVITANCTLAAPGLIGIHTNLSLGVGTLTLSGALRVYGNLAVPAGTVLDDSGNFTITVDGNWANTGGTFTSGTGTVVFAGGVAQTVNPGSSSFRNLTVQGGSTLAVLTNALTVTGTLTIATAGDTADMTDRDFTVSTLVNNGVLALDGTQATQTITTMDIDTGTVRYEGASGGTIRLWDGASASLAFFNLAVSSAGNTFTLSRDSLVHGNVTIAAGTTFDVSASNYAVTVTGDWNNTGGTFVARQGTVTFDKPAGIIRIYGDNTWFVFDCQVPGITIQFETNVTQQVMNVTGAIFRVKGTAGSHIILDRIPPGVGTHWIFTVPALAVLDIVYVDVNWSSATVPITLPADVTVANCINWLTTIYVIGNSTEDFDGNGKIDRIRVKAQANIGRVAKANFADFSVILDAPYILRVNPLLIPPRPYELTIDSGDDPDAASLAADEFWILVNEQPMLDTDAVPQWLIDNNTSLRDSATDQYIVALTNPVPWKETAADSAKPVLAYTLAVADKDQIYVQFSEPVTDGGAIGTTSFTFKAANPLSVAPVGASGYLLTVSAAITASEIVVPLNLTASGGIRDTALNAIAVTVHRVSDLGLGLTATGIIEPVWAHDQTLSDAAITGLGRINLFDGTKWLRDQDITVTGSVHTAITLDPDASPDAKLWYDVSVPGSLKSASGLWLPPFNSSTYNGIVPYQDSSARSATGSPVGGQNHDYAIPGSDPEIVDGARLEFLFEIMANGGTVGNDLYCARVTDPAAVDWYLRCVPWAFDIHEIRMQKGSVNILSNVINPDLAQVVTLQYVQPTKGSVTVSVFDLAGNLVRVLTRVSGQDIGDYAVTWDGKNKGGRSVARGIYFIRVVAPGIDETRKVLVVR